MNDERILFVTTNPFVMKQTLYIQDPTGIYNTTQSELNKVPEVALGMANDLKVKKIVILGLTSLSESLKDSIFELNSKNYSISDLEIQIIKGEY